MKFTSCREVKHTSHEKFLLKGLYVSLISFRKYTLQTGYPNLVHTIPHGAILETRSCNGPTPHVSCGIDQVLLISLASYQDVILLSHVRSGMDVHACSDIHTEEQNAVMCYVIGQLDQMF